MTQQRDAGRHRADEYLLPWPVPEPPKVVVKRDLLPAVSVLSTVALLGMAVGWLWSRLAPAQLSAVVEGGKYIPLRSESYHRFEDMVLFLLLSLAAGLITGVGVWMLRERRGPVMLLAATGGSALAAWLATQVGVSWAQSRFAVTATPQLGDVIAIAPRLESAWVVLAWPLATALAYAVAAAWNGEMDLGRRLG
ncbi:DUF2567 domain-containing protein [Actinokineospora soli]|uniref:DUF2567 domain-containing protein n=1 Tax=Actinokineospora soli TaxID=1048753 RepID=A0ABW2TSE6_9PSEU